MSALFCFYSSIFHHGTEERRVSSLVQPSARCHLLGCQSTERHRSTCQSGYVNTCRMHKNDDLVCVMESHVVIKETVMSEIVTLFSQMQRRVSRRPKHVGVDQIITP